MPLWEMPVGRVERVNEGCRSTEVEVDGGRKSQRRTKPSEEPVAKRSTFLGFQATLETTSRCSVHTPISSLPSTADPTPFCSLASLSLERGLGRRDLSGDVARDAWLLGTLRVSRSRSFFLGGFESALVSLPSPASFSSSASLIRARFRGFSFRVSPWAGFFMALSMDGGGEGDRARGAGDELGRLLFLLPFALSLSLLSLGPSSGGGNGCGRFGGGGGALDVWRTAGRGRGGLDPAEG